MTVFNYLCDNLKWQFRQNPFKSLLCEPTTEAQTVAELDKTANEYFPQNARISTFQTEFCLNKIALDVPSCEAQRLLKSVFPSKWTAFCRLKNIFARPYMRFPSDGKKTRVERIAETIVRCTQNCATPQKTQELLQTAYNLFNLTNREKQYLEEVLQLVYLQHYCALYAAKCDVKTAKVLRPQLLTKPFVPNKHYVQAVYRKGKISAVLNCFGNSVLSFGQQDLSYKQTVKIYASGRNVFDTFTHCRHGQQTAEFRSESGGLTTEMQYFLTDFCQIKRFRLTNKSKLKRKYVVDIRTEGGREPFFCEDCYTVTDNDVYLSTAVVTEGGKATCDVRDGTLSFVVELQPQQTDEFALVMVVSRNIDVVRRQLSALDNFGSTLCGVCRDRPSVEYTSQRSEICGLTSFNNQPRQVTPPAEQETHYTYRFGNADVGTVMDNDGNQATLLNGFCFGKGESVYSVVNGQMTRLDQGDCKVDGQNVTYDNRQSQLTVSHEQGKRYTVCHKQAAKTLFYFPFESSGHLSRRPDGFSFVNADRRFDITFDGVVDSYTTDALECNTDRLRYKLSGNGNGGTCLAICFAKADKVVLTLTNRFTTPQPKPILHESLVSTYLNYVNGKSVFCLNNKLVRPDPLTLAAICYTNPDFVRQYVGMTFARADFAAYYDANGKLVTTNNPLLTALATVYYANLVCDQCFPSAAQVKQVQEVLLSDGHIGKDLCVQALALRKATKIAAFSRAECAAKYALLKKKICADNTLYAYAQAIGAVELTNPSKQRLRDLCNKLNVPKGWYYVSQIENLYGMDYSVGKLSFAPKIANDNVLEQISLTVGGRKISTTFKRSNVQSMTLNGITRFQPFYPATLKQTDNTLVVTY